VHTPYFLQKMLLGPYLEETALEELRGTFSNILHSIGTVSDRDQAFAEDVCPGMSGWWDDGRACDYRTLSNLATAKLEQVCIFNWGSKLYSNHSSFELRTSSRQTSISPWTTWKEFTIGVFGAGALRLGEVRGRDLEKPLTFKTHPWIR
jgi:hypothetical protein